MKTHRYQRRFYRDWVNAKDLHHTHIMARETDLQILTNKKLDRAFVEDKIRSLRWDIENYITRDSRFLSALKPIPVELTAPAIIQEMALQAKAADVGPMATVAGAIAQFLGKELLKKGYKDVIIENGGDIFIVTTKVRHIGIYAGRSKIWNKLKIKVSPKDSPLGVCTSSGTVGHSTSFGVADSAVIISKNCLLADAVATATANKVTSRKDMQAAIDFARKVKGITGAIVILKSNLLSWGSIKFAK